MKKETRGEGHMKFSAWERVRIAREMDRPTSLYYIEHIFEDFIELHGDRGIKDDPAIVGGIGFLEGQPVTVIGQQKGRNLKEQVERNFGMPNPEGYRKALRLMKQAEKFHRPVVCFVDTSGAFCGVEAEERGQGEAIARNLMEMAGLTVPVLSIVIGEGGSGGALALAVGNEVWCLEHSVYSVLSPEGFAAILWKDGKRADEAAEVMKMTSEHLKALKVVDRVFAEPEPVHVDHGEALAEEIKQAMTEFFQRYERMASEEVVKERYERFRHF